EFLSVGTRHEKVSGANLVPRVDELRFADDLVLSSLEPSRLHGAYLQDAPLAVTRRRVLSHGTLARLDGTQPSTKLNTAYRPGHRPSHNGILDGLELDQLPLQRPDPPLERLVRGDDAALVGQRRQGDPQVLDQRRTDLDHAFARATRSRLNRPSDRCRPEHDLQVLRKAVLGPRAQPHHEVRVDAIHP